MVPSNKTKPEISLWRRYPVIILLAAVLFLLLVKIPLLSLPFFWDEAVPYSYAVREMFQQGPSLLPSAINTEYSRGHPLLFHFMEVLWMNLFGSSITSMHTFPLIVSVLLILACYQTVSTWFDKTTASFASALLVVQSVFLAQSTFVLPEMLLCLFMLLSIYFFQSKNFIGYFFAASALVLTKETGIIVIPALMIFRFIRDVHAARRMKGQFLLEQLKIFSPAGIAILFFILQYRTHGWFFFPQHLDYMSFSWTDFLNKLEGYAAFVFIYQGRNCLTVLLLAGIIASCVKKRKSMDNTVSTLLLLLWIMLLYLLFSALNFYSNRYMLVLVLLLSILAAVAIRRLLTENPYFHYALWLMAVVTGLHFCFFNRSDNDHSMGYVDAIRVHQQVVSYCSEKKWQNKNICTSFLMANNLRNNQTGYLGRHQGFTSITPECNAQTEVYILLSEDKQNEVVLKQKQGFALVKRFQVNACFAEIYAR